MTCVLVVDADKTLRSQVVEAFERAEYSVRSAASAQTAIGACEEQKPDLIILELQLRGHSGVEFLHELRSYPEWQNIPVILCTLVPISELERFKTAFETIGVVGYAYKPETSLKKLVSLADDVVATLV